MAEMTEQSPFHEVFGLLATPVRKALIQLGFVEPTAPQEEAVPVVLSGENVLLIAPNGSGKTEAVLLPVFSNLIQKPKRKGISLLYITPLRALNRDMIKRLSYWSDELGISIEVRHGDTEVKIRRRQALHPPDMLVTTPETLQAILPGTRMQKHLRNVQHVIIDEVHELAESKRGVQLTVAFERLFEIVGREFQRVGLSATVGNPKKVAGWIHRWNKSTHKSNRRAFAKGIPIHCRVSYPRKLRLRPSSGTENRPRGCCEDKANLRFGEKSQFNPDLRKQSNKRRDAGTQIQPTH